MHSVQDDCEWRRVVQQLLEMFYGLFFGHVQTEFAEYLLVHIAVFDVGDVSVGHEGHQVEDEVRAFPEDREGCEAELLEAGVMHGLYAAHGIDHFLAHLDWWC